MTEQLIISFQDHDYKLKTADNGLHDIESYILKQLYKIWIRKGFFAGGVGEFNTTKIGVGR